MPPLTDADGRLLPGRCWAGGTASIGIGSGGMGTVYAARSRETIGRRLEGHQCEPYRRIRRRRPLSARRPDRLRARHPNIVEVFDVGQVDGDWFMAMELLEGTNLADAIARGRTFEPAEAVPVLREVLDALGGRASAPIVHRDLKPQNIFLCRSLAGAPLGVKVLDFGVAKVVGQSAAGTADALGHRPRNARVHVPGAGDGHERRPRSDLYAVGCVAYAMLCGRPPFLDDWPMRVVDEAGVRGATRRRRACGPIAGGGRRRSVHGRARWRRSQRTAFNRRAKCARRWMRWLQCSERR